MLDISVSGCWAMRGPGFRWNTRKVFSRAPPRISLAVPLSVGVTADNELIDISITH